jgi:hypothetical protein
MEPAKAWKAELEKLQKQVKRGFPAHSIESISTVLSQARNAIAAVSQKEEWRMAVKTEATRTPSAQELVAARPEVQAARDVLTRAEELAARSQRAFQAFARQPKWLASTKELLFKSHTKVLEEYARAVGRARAAPQHLKDVVRAAHPACIAEADSMEKRAQETQARAKEVRERMEAPVRAALLEARCMVAMLHTTARVTPLEHAPSDRTLEFLGVRETNGAILAEFRGARGDRYLADTLFVRDLLDSAKLTPGDKIQLSQDGAARSVPRVAERGPNLHPETLQISGIVADVKWNGRKLESIELIDASGTRRHVLPCKGDDLTKELPQSAIYQIRKGMEIQLARGQLVKAARPFSSERGRA